MKRAPDLFGQQLFDLVIVGGGITGSCVARDAAMRGLSVALCEARDFSSATSAGTTKLVHGGLRYLRNLEISLVRESLAERRVWFTLAPHMVAPLPFLLPVYGGMRQALTIGAGLSLYDLLAFDRNQGTDPAKHMPAHRRLSRAEALEREPALDPRGLTAAFVYHDGQMYQPERLGLACLADAAQAGAVIANYVEAVQIEEAHDHLRLTCTDRLSEARYLIRGRIIVNATGPWADGFLARAVKETSSARLQRSKGIHLVVPELTRGHALFLDTPRGHLFVIPWRGHSLVGTTDTPFEDDPSTLGLEAAEIRTLLASLIEALPGAAVDESRVRYAYAGLRPLIATPARQSTYSASRRAEIVDHERTGGPARLITALGGKWTTSRQLAERIVDHVERKLGRGPTPTPTAEEPLAAGKTGPFDAFRNALESDFPTVARPTIDLLARTYGRDARALIQRAMSEPLLAEALIPGRSEIALQVVHAVEQEMAQTLDDVVLRRTGLGTLGLPPEATLARIAALMGDTLGWNPTRRAREIAATQAHYRFLDALKGEETVSRAQP